MNPNEAAGWFDKLIDKVGPLAAFAIVLLLGGMFCAWRLFVWFKPIGERVAEGHIRLTNGLADTLPDVKQNQEKMLVTQDVHGKRLDEVIGHVQVIRGAMGKS